MKRNRLASAGQPLWRCLQTGLAMLLLAGCAGAPATPSGDSGGTGGDTKMPASSFRLTSKVFQEGGQIPAVYTCDGKDTSPPLAWEAAPEGTRSYALILDDPDARNFVHWLIYNIPGAQSELSEDVARVDQLENGALQGKNSWGRNGYGGPCPPSGTHRYRFVLYALDTTLNLPAGADRTRLEAAMRGHILAQAQLVGRYSRQGR